MEPSTTLAPPTSALPRLFPPPAIFLASLLGTPIAGSFLLTYNALRLKQRIGAVIAFAMGFLVSITLLGVLQYLPRSFFPFVFLAAGALAMTFVTNVLQGDSLASHRAAKGPIPPFFVAPVLGLLITASLVAFQYRAQHIATYTLAPNQLLLYTDYTVTPDQAQRTAKVLQSVGLYQPAELPHAYQLIHAADHFVVLFTVDPAKADSSEIDPAFQSLATKLAAELEQPVVLALIDTKGRSLKQFPSTQPVSH